MKTRQPGFSSGPLDGSYASRLATHCRIRGVHPPLVEGLGLASTACRKRGFPNSTKAIL
jgi:hypothetical protein